MPADGAGAAAAGGSAPCQPPGRLGADGGLKLLAGRTNDAEAVPLVNTPPRPPPPAPSPDAAPPSPDAADPPAVIAPGSAGAIAPGRSAPPIPVNMELNGLNKPDSWLGAEVNSCGNWPPIPDSWPPMDPSDENWPSIEPIDPIADIGEPASASAGFAPWPVASTVWVIDFALACRAPWVPDWAAEAAAAAAGAAGSAALGDSGGGVASAASAASTTV